MTIILDENIPRALKLLLDEVEVVTVQDADLAGIKNGELLSLIDGTYDVFITADKNLKYQQNLSTRRIAIIELYSNRLPDVEHMAEAVKAALATVTEGDFLQIAPLEKA